MGLRGFSVGWVQARYNQIREEVGGPLVFVHPPDTRADSSYIRDILLKELLQLSKTEVLLDGRG